MASNVKTVYIPVLVYVPVEKTDMLDNIVKESKLQKKKRDISSESCEGNSSISSKKRVKTTYYQSEFITNPCEQLFGPTALDLSLKSDKNDDTNTEIAHDDYYIPTPKWSKMQISVLEEFFRKGRYPKSIEIKSIAKRLHVMDSDVEEWFRKRRGRDRKIKRKNEHLKVLIDNYIHH